MRNTESGKENHATPSNDDSATAFNCQCRKRLRNEFVRGLLKQQAQHQSLGMSDPKGLLAHSRANSKEARLRARQEAMANAKDIYEGVVGVDYEFVDDSFSRRNSKKKLNSKPSSQRFSRKTSNRKQLQEAEKTIATPKLEISRSFRSIHRQKVDTDASGGVQVSARCA